MKGLLLKDFYLMKMQKKFFIVVIALAIGMAFLNNDISFIVGYLTFIVPIFAISTISYDELDNGNAFLFTLPISRKLYVVEKYCFCLLLGAAATGISLLLSVLLGIIKDIPFPSDTVEAVPIIFSIMVFILSFMIPLHLKFGAEKARIALIVLVGIAVALGFAISRLSDKLGYDILSMFNTFSTMNIWLLIAIVAAVALIALMISIKISIAVMNKKEF